MSELSQIYLGACIGYALFVICYIAISFAVVALRKKEDVNVKLTECSSLLETLDNTCE